MRKMKYLVTMPTTPPRNAPEHVQKHWPTRTGIAFADREDATIFMAQNGWDDSMRGPFPIARAK